MLDFLVDFVTQLLPIADSLGIYIYLIIFLVSAFESTPILGTFTPGSIMLVFFGFLSAMTSVLLVPCILAAAFGGVIGDYLGYLLGRYGSKFFKHNKGLLRYSHLEMGKEFFTKHGGKSIFIGRFIGPLRPVVPLVAGATRMSINRFLPLNITSATIWASILIGTGYIVGEQWRKAENIFSTIGIVLAALCVAFLVRWYLKWRTENIKN